MTIDTYMLRKTGNVIYAMQFMIRNSNTIQEKLHGYHKKLVLLIIETADGARISSSEGMAFEGQRAPLVKLDLSISPGHNKALSDV